MAVRTKHFEVHQTVVVDDAVLVMKLHLDRPTTPLILHTAIVTAMHIKTELFDDGGMSVEKLLNLFAMQRATLRGVNILS